MIAVVQLDGLGAEPTSRLLAAGRLPNLEALLAGSASGPLETPAPLFPAAVYPTLYSGLEPGRHGLFYPFQWSAADQRVLTADRLPRPPAIWHRLAVAGLRSLVIDPYECPPSAAAGSRLISGWQLRERVVLQRWSRPRSFGPRALLRHGPPPGATETFGAPRERELRALARALRRAPARVAALLEQELVAGSFDLAWVSLLSPHLGGHRLWGTPELDAVYGGVDDAVGRILAALPARARLIVVCPIGMDADHSRADLLPQMLERVLDPRGTGSGAEDDSVATGAIWRLRAAVPPGPRAAAAAAIPPALARSLTARMELRGVEWSRTRAFAHPSDNQGYIRLNLRGREREGIVEPAEADALCEEIASGLAEFADRSGAPVVDAIERTDRHERGEQADLLPDLVVRWRPGGEQASAHSPRLGDVHRHGAGSGRTGNHPAGGAWVALPGAAGEPAAARRRLVDVAATIASWAGLADLADLDGSPLAVPRPANPPADRPDPVPAGG